MKLSTDKIILDWQAQPRAHMNSEIVEEYTEAWKDGAQFPPVIVFSDGVSYWLADGWHRVNGAKAAGIEEIDADVRAGALRDAILYSVGANSSHGVRRTNEDKRRAVTVMLQDAEWGVYSNRQIAKMCNVSDVLVLNIRKEIDTANIGSIQTARTFIHPKTGEPTTMQTANIGQRQSAPEEQAVQNYVTCETCNQMYTASIGHCPYCTGANKVWLREQTNNWSALTPQPPPHVAKSSGYNEWYTPAEYIQAARLVLGEIDLDPASSEEANTVVKARKIYTIDDDGLSQPWYGRVWMNPPYSADLIGKFCDKIITEPIDAAVILVNNATETRWFVKLTSMATAIVFPTSRIIYWEPGGHVGTPLQGQAFIYIGDNPDLFLNHFSGFGWGARIEHE